MNRATTILTYMLICSSILPRALVDKGDFLDTDLFFKMKQSLEMMCPGVDICDRNKTNPHVLPNRLIGDDIISCCEGCSCNEKCHEELNCCFPSEGNLTQTDPSKYTSLECMYVQTGTPDVDWPGRVPAYRIVSSAPPGGCKTGVSGPLLNERGLVGGCERRKDLLPWGDLFPVYSIEHDAIYKNELCACCHGAVHPKPWKPYFICNEYSKSKRPLSVSEHLQFVDNNFEESHCSVTFRYPYPSVLLNKRCSLDTKSTCKFESFTVPPNLNLTTEEVIQACGIGIEAPIMIHQHVFKNVFCAVCSTLFTEQPSLRCKLSQADNSGRFWSHMSLLLSLDAYLYRPGSLLVERHGEQRNPQTCRRYTEQSMGGCRIIFCPSGQIRNQEGKCIFTTTAWFKESFSINVKIEYAFYGKDFWTMMSENETSVSELSEMFQESNPWSSNWTIRGILLDASGIHDNDYMMTIFTSKTNNPKVLYEDLKTSFGLPWTFILNNSSYIGQQSFLNYNMFNVINKTLYPMWTKKNDNFERLGAFSTSHGYHEWKPIRPTIIWRRRPTFLTKTFICIQVALQPDEYMLMADDTILASNLTLRVLFEAEFEIVQDDNRLLTARVCLGDTVFETRAEINNSSVERSTRLIFLAVGITVLWVGL